MEANSSLLLSALYNAAFGLFHLSFWKLFRWDEELPRLGKVNRSVMQILNLRLTYVFFFFGLIFAVLAHEGEHGLLPTLLVGGMALFWLMRAFEQVWFFGWRNTVSNIMLGTFLVGAALHVSAAATVWK